MNIMELKNVVYAYENKKKVLKGINLSVEEGKMYAILGPSGCGKTTLLSLMGGLDSPTNGQILYDGQDIQIAQDTTKTKSSMRTLPLVPAFKEKLLKLKEQQEEYRRVCGRCYNKKYLEYICVDEMGTLISPHYLTASFPKLLEKNNLRHIRFHDLRHSCASLLLANGVPMKQIQEWLGHSDFSTTANVYAHLDYNSKLSSADAMVNGLSGALEVIS